MVVTGGSDVVTRYNHQMELAYLESSFILVEYSHKCLKSDYIFAEQGSKEMITSKRETLEGAIRDKYQKKSSVGVTRGPSFRHLFFLNNCSHKCLQMDFHSFFQMVISFAMKIKRIDLEFR